MNAIRAYARVQSETASRERLMLLLFEAALRHMRAGAAALEAGHTATAVTRLTKAGDIVAELETTLDHRQAPDLCARLVDVYRFVAVRLVEAVAHGQSHLAREAERVFAPLVEAFTAAVSSAGVSR